MAVNNKNSNNNNNCSEIHLWNSGTHCRLVGMVSAVPSNWRQQDKSFQRTQFCDFIVTTAAHTYIFTNLSL
jgi:hypothetical protein